MSVSIQIDDAAAVQEGAVQEGAVQEGAVQGSAVQQDDVRESTVRQRAALEDAALEESFDPFELTDSAAGDVRDPYPLLAELRRKGPVHVGPIDFTGSDLSAHCDGGDEPLSVSVLGHDEVARALRDDTTFSSTVYEGVIGMVMGRTIVQMDEPDHRLHRALVSPAFRSRVLERWETGLVSSVVDGLVDRFVERGHADLVRTLTFAFPVQVIARILGLPMRDYPKFQRWTAELLSVSENWDRGVAASEKLGQYLQAVIDEHRRQPADDLISDLVAAEVAGERLDDDEIISFLRLLLPAGVETTYRATGTLLFGLLSQPDQLAALREDRTLFAQAFEEALRWEPPITLILRRTMSDTVLADVAIPAGTDVAFFLGAANRDPRRYADPDRFDMFRPPQQHVGFGFGVHMCLGMHLARMESRVAVNAVLDRLGDVRLDPAPGEDPHIQGLAFRSPTSLPVSFSAR